MGKIRTPKYPTDKLIKRLLKAGIDVVHIVPTIYFDHAATPILYISYKQFDALMKTKPKQTIKEKR